MSLPHPTCPAPGWPSLAHLQAGTPRQQQAWATLHHLDLWSVLAPYGPVLAGTIPLAIDLPDSDLDVICHVPRAIQLKFAQLLRRRYGHLPGFWVQQGMVGGWVSITVHFRAGELPVEIFGQPQPAARQHACRHLRVEAAVLAAGGEPWRAAVHQLRQQGMKTEPAFAQLLGLPGPNPYQALLVLEEMSPAALLALVANTPLP